MAKSGRKIALPALIALGGAVAFISLAVGIGWLFDFGKQRPAWGVTFSDKYASELGQDWKEVYESILTDLRPDKLRLIAYWDEIEEERGEYDFEGLDWQIKRAKEEGIGIVLAVGHRVPRWPECHHPDWTKGLSEQEFEEAVMEYLAQVIGRYEDEEIVEAWQIENEPLFLLFGQCPEPDREFLKKEVALAKALDPKRPAMVTDSGELSTWTKAAGISEIFGTTVYRVVWNEYIGWFKHLYPPAWYSLRAWLIVRLTDTEKVVISELQAEPWGEDNKPITEISFGRQTMHFSPERLRDTLAFARKTGIGEIYIWGAEWWHFRKSEGDDRFWKIGKEAVREP